MFVLDIRERLKHVRRIITYCNLQLGEHMAMKYYNGCK